MVQSKHVKGNSFVLPPIVGRLPAATTKSRRASQAALRQKLAHVRQAIEVSHGDHRALAIAQTVVERAHVSDTLGSQHAPCDGTEMMNVDLVDLAAHFLDAHAPPVHLDLSSDILDLHKPALERHDKAALQLVLGALQLSGLNASRYVGKCDKFELSGYDAGDVLIEV